MGDTATETFETIYYSLPANLISEGMSTDDAQDVLEVDTIEDYIVLTVYTPRSDDPEQDAINRSEPEVRGYEPGERVNLAVFVDTKADGSRDWRAIVTRRQVVTVDAD